MDELNEIAEYARSTGRTTVAVKLLTKEDLEELTGIPARTFDQYAYRGIGPDYVKLGRHRRYRPEAVEAWIDENTRQTRGGGRLA